LNDMSFRGGNGVNRPATGISWYEAAKFVNYLNTSTGGTAAYKFVDETFTMWSAGDSGYNANNIFRNSLAKYVIPSFGEWYKGAYGNPNGSWSGFPNGTDTAPTAVARGTDTNTAVYFQDIYTGPADINNAGGLSAYGTMGQGGNVWEWNETASDGTNNTAGESRGLSGGNWYFQTTYYLGASYAPLLTANPGEFDSDWGFRVAMIPEPSSLSLLALGGVVVALRRRR